MGARCPYCGAMANVVRNPFYGTGLAVHETIVDCRKCSRVRLQGERREPAATPAPPPTPAPAATGKRRFFGILRPQLRPVSAR